MPNVCFYFQVHQPYRLRDLRITDIGREDTEYFDDEKNRAVFRKVAEKCYLPTNRLLLDMLAADPDFAVSFSLSGVFLDQCKEYGEDVLDSFRALAATGRVEFLAETDAHSLSYLGSLEEFCLQVRSHVEKIQRLFGCTPTVFRNTELVYCNDLAHVARLLGFRGILAEGADAILDGKTPNVPYAPPRFRLPAQRERVIRTHRPHVRPSTDITILLKNYRLSDDIAFRFSNRSWAGFPLYADTFADWVAQSEGHSVNLFMDYETFGEHQWADTGIFDFLRSLPAAFRSRGIATRTPSQVIDDWRPHRNKTGTFDAHACISWADMERDLSAWLGNDIQHAAFTAVYALEGAVRASGDPDLIEAWRRLQTSDHLYYMCTKYWNDGDVHKYFSPYESPYEAYRRFSHALEDLRLRLGNRESGAGRRGRKSQYKHRSRTSAPMSESLFPNPS
ncbi:MAG: alpha-amylase/alpha-mannosidase [Candidatus Peregrinibacteria bacterium Gr01-1014_25]|nr:MAG: alpha-amylase/alpha-mannosidase [Candidatus Peregrinibacteria bacterium Gr01-1014_25]